MSQPEAWAAEWSIRPGTIYLNHGSFGPSPDVVRRARQRWYDELESEPMDFLARRLEGELTAAAGRLAQFVGSPAGDLAMVENATYGMNVVAANFPLSAGDEVLLTDHEYGAVVRIWERACRKAGATLVRAVLPFPPQSDDEIVEAICDGITPKTRLVVFSHVTSPTALVLPAEKICRAVRARDVSVCVDGPHAPAHVPLDIGSLDCDYYTASCHKWLCAPFGSGFLYVHPRRQQEFEPLILSWGRMEPDRPRRWSDEFLWAGTRDPSAFLSVPASIDFMESAGLEAFRARSHALAESGARLISEMTGLPPVVDAGRWHGSMVLAELPAGESWPLRESLWKGYGIEVPIIDWGRRRFVRISCHLYNRPEHLEQLAQALKELIA